MEKVTSKGNNHKKHGNTSKARYGNFARNELAIMGLPCGEIRELAEKLISSIPKLSIAYYDADHKSDEEERGDLLNAGASLVITDKIQFERFDFDKSSNNFEKRNFSNDIDLLLVNGNHFTAKKQLLFIDKRKSLEKKLDHISDPIAIVLNEFEEIPAYLKDHISGIDQIPVYNAENVQALIDTVSSITEKPQLFGLVLAGGKSTRMGQDKGLIDYYGLPQREYVFELLSNFTEKTFYSCRSDQLEEFEKSDQPAIADTFLELGPYGGILSAFRKYPDAAWLVLACDIPLVNRESLQFLVDNRNPSKTATCFYNPETDFPDPLVTIWEPRAYPRLLHFLSMGYGCPRKVLINSTTEVLHAPNPTILKNANNPEELEEIQRLLKKPV